MLHCANASSRSNIVRSTSQDLDDDEIEIDDDDDINSTAVWQSQGQTVSAVITKWIAHL